MRAAPPVWHFANGACQQRVAASNINARRARYRRPQRLLAPFNFGLANCFGKCGFFGSPEEVPPEPEDPTIEDWEQLNVECTSDDFCTADDNLATCGARTVEDIVEEAACGAADSSDDGDDIDVGDVEGPPPVAETLHALDVLRRAVAADEVSDDTCRRFYAFEQSLLGY
ncbi:hypothetical protein MRX96_033818 [Rhipicephalus microplus]